MDRTSESDRAVRPKPESRDDCRSVGELVMLVISVEIDSA